MEVQELNLEHAPAFSVSDSAVMLNVIEGGPFEVGRFWPLVLYFMFSLLRLMLVPKTGF